MNNMDLFSYLLGKNNGDKPAILQDKEVTITENKETTIEPDEGYDGLSSAIVTTNVDNPEKYFNTHPENLSSITNWMNNNFIKEYPDLYIPETVDGLYWLFTKWGHPTVPKIICGNNIISLYQLCYQNTIITTIDCTGININSNVNMDMGDAFYGSNRIVKIDLHNLRPQGPISAYTSFARCTLLEEVDISGLVNVTSLRECFYDCQNLKKVDMRNLLLTNVTNTTNWLYNVPYSCLFIVKDNEQKTWFNTYFAGYTNVKTAEEYEASN